MFNKKRIYFDNGSTSYPKANGLGRALKNFVEKKIVNTGRTTSSLLYNSNNYIYELREQICKIYNYNNPEYVIFTSGITESLNTVLKGLIKKGDDVIITNFEHNSVTRVLKQIGCSFSLLPFESGFKTIFDKRADDLIKPNTKFLAINATSNITGASVNLKECSDFAKKHNLIFIIDSAQATPFLEIDMKKISVDVICFTFHKALYGPDGCGGFVVSKEIAPSLTPLIVGGTGSFSDSADLPKVYPDRLRAGTENNIGLYGALHSLLWTEKNFKKIKDKTLSITRYLYSKLCKFEFLEIVSVSPFECWTNIVSVKSSVYDVSEISAFLLKEGNIETRVGIHCSYLATNAINNDKSGTLRFTPGFFNTKREVDKIVNIIKEFHQKKVILK